MTKSPYQVANTYYDSIENILDCMHTHNMSQIPFDEVYRSNYTLTIQKHHDVIILAYEILKDDLKDFNYSIQLKYLNMINDMFMYPIRVGVIKHSLCLVCKIETSYNELHCKTHKIHTSYLPDIKQFTKFKNEGMYGGKLWMKAMNDDE
jgi:hypothetical protein